MGYELFPARLAAAKEARKGATNKSIGEAVGVTAQTVSEWINGHSEPGAQNFIDLADHLRVTLDYLGGRVDDPRMRYGESEASSKLAAIALIVNQSGNPSDEAERLSGAEADRSHRGRTSRRPSTSQQDESA